MMAVNIPDLTILVHFTDQSSILDDVSKNKKIMPPIIFRCHGY